jgi:RNA polymerase sigma-70 factor (ECF subfamily)
VRRHHGIVFRVAAGVLKDEDMAADAAQDAFIRAFRSLDGFRGDAAFRTWLLTITTNVARGLLRSRGRRREVPLDGVAPIAENGPDASRRLAVLEEVGRARACLARLPEKQRLAVQLRVDEGLSFREVGEAIGSSEGAARVNYHHGIRRLREMMEA